MRGRVSQNLKKELNQEAKRVHDTSKEQQWDPPGRVSLVSEAHALLDGERKLALERLKRRVGRQVDAVEARMRLGQLVHIARLFDREPPRSVRSLQILEAVYGDPRGARGELQQTRLLLRGPCAHALPEPLHHLVLLGEATVVGELLPIVHIDLRHAADEQLELALVKHVDQILRNQLGEAADERLELLLDALADAPLGHELDVLLLVLVRHLDLLSALLELDGDHLAKLVLDRGEGLFDDALDAVVEHPLERTMVVGIHRLEIAQRDLLLENHLVERHDKVGVEEASVEDGEAEHAADELEVVEMLRVDARVRVDLQRVVVVRAVLEEARAELRDALGLHGEVAAVGAHDSENLLSSRVDPGGGSGVVVHKVRSAFGGVALFPAGGKRAVASRGARASREGVGGGGGARAGDGRASRRGAGGIAIADAEEIVGQGSVAVPLTIGRGGAGGGGRVGAGAGGRAGPSCGARVVIDVVGAAEMVGPTLPASGGGGGGGGGGSGTGRRRHAIGRRCRSTGDVSICSRCGNGCGGAAAGGRGAGIGASSAGGRGSGERGGGGVGCAGHEEVGGAGGGVVVDGGGDVGVEVDDELAVHDEIVVGFFELLVEQTLSAKFEVENVGDADVDHAQEALIALLELLLVEDLDSDDGGVGDGDIEAVVPVRVERLFDDGRGMGLLSVDGDDGERIGKTEDITLGQSIGGNDGDANLSRKRAGAPGVDHGWE
ncbi:hypothetical protein L1887_56668 [Cichorium endivia]|nr:hypothetical protein L1887_56668 [Cichorium endivia]